MKRKLFIFLSATVLCFTWSCTDYLDVNHDPDAMESIPDAKVLLPAAQLGIANNLMGWHFGFGGGFWVQYWTQSYTASQFKTLCEYLPQDFNTAYVSLMREPMPDLKRIKTLTENDENKGLYFIAEALSIFTWQIITDVWGDMPYSEALRGDEGIYHPKQDTQQNIYADLLKRIDALLNIDLVDPSTDEYYTVDGRYDFIFAGDMEVWECFARSLKMKLLLRLSETPLYNSDAVYEYVYESDYPNGGAIFGYPYNEAAHIILADEGGAKIKGSVWNDAMEGKRHPMREFQEGGANYLSTNVRGCKSFVDYLRDNGDPRLATLFDGNLGAFFGDFDSRFDSEGSGTTDDKQSWCTVNSNSFTDLFLMSPWEIYFDIAEVAARAGDLDNAQYYYEEAVLASLAQHKIKDDGILDGGYAEWQGGTVEECIKQIAMQRWVANCNYQHIEAFLERNRTKYPAVNEIDIRADRRYAWDNFPVGYLTISVNGRNLLNGNLPASPLYPDNYIMRNNNAPSQKPNVGMKVWWNQKAGK